MTTLIAAGGRPPRFSLLTKAGMSSASRAKRRLSANEILEVRRISLIVKTPSAALYIDPEMDSQVRVGDSTRANATLRCGQAAIRRRAPGPPTTQCLGAAMTRFRTGPPLRSWSLNSATTYRETFTSRWSRANTSILFVADLQRNSARISANAGGVQQRRRCWLKAKSLKINKRLDAGVARSGLQNRGLPVQQRLRGAGDSTRLSSWRSA